MEKRFEDALTQVIRINGHESPITIWFCSELELHPDMSDAKLARLVEIANEDPWDWDED